MAKSGGVYQSGVLVITFVLCRVFEETPAVTGSHCKTSRVSLLFRCSNYCLILFISIVPVKQSQSLLRLNTQIWNNFKYFLRLNTQSSLNFTLNWSGFSAEVPRLFRYPDSISGRNSAGFISPLRYIFIYSFETVKSSIFRYVWQRGVSSAQSTARIPV